MTDAVLTRAFSSAVELLQFIDPYDAFWNGNQRSWIFRGLSDESYQLIPSALRNNPPASLGYTHEPKIGVQSTYELQIRAEFDRIQEFYWYCDAQGLSIPIDDNVLRTPLGWYNLNQQLSNGWPIDCLLYLMALAQHHGVHTRLLDWSDNPLVAAYFAARAAYKENLPEYISLWGLNLHWTLHSGFPADNGKHVPVYVISAPRAANSYFHAQGSVFTTEQINTSEIDSPVMVKTLDQFVEEKWSSHPTAFNVMVHLKLPGAEARAMLRLLDQKGINAANLFPGFQGVASYLKERSHWDVIERTSSWLY